VNPHRTRKPLTRCPLCSSRLIFPLSVEVHHSSGMIIERRCPECEHRDVVVTDLLAAQVWARRERRLRSQLVRTVLDLELAEILAAAPA
jgi:DNA-directed RNA polymerase subunit RPC12/RpoP